MGRIRFGWAQVALGVGLLACGAWLGGPAEAQPAAGITVAETPADMGSAMLKAMGLG